jgi:excinuclease UvrABC ATPase subunit
LLSSRSKASTPRWQRSNLWLRVLQNAPAEDPAFFDEAAALTQEQRLVAERTLPDIHARLKCLSDVGIGYLGLDRPTRTLSGGEFQRARLAASLSSQLHGAHFVLDEPTAGLHPRDTQRLLKTLFDLRDAGGTVIVVEHDGEIMRAADWLVDLGPGAGADGGTCCSPEHRPMPKSLRNLQRAIIFVEQRLNEPPSELNEFEVEGQG